MKRLAILAAAAALAACDDTNVHLLYGQQYDSQYGCMGPEQSIDVINGADPGQSCAPVCITAQLDGEAYVYITTTCPPYDPQYPSESQSGHHAPTDPCAPAFAAYAAGIECARDGGPPPDGGLDAGHDAEAGFDATVDSGSGVDAGPESGAETGADAQPAGDAAMDGPGE